MKTFTPVNSLETKLRAVITDRNTPLWNFYTPLAAAPLWIVVQNFPEMDGSDEIAPPGQNPGLCVMQTGKDSWIGFYTSAARANEAFEKFKISPHAFRIASAPGYQLLRFATKADPDASLCMNLGLSECQFVLDPDMVEILLERPEPDYEKRPSDKIRITDTTEAEKHLAPLSEFLGRQPTVRAAWIYQRKSDTPSRAGHEAYEFSLLMNDPEDDSLLKQVETMLKALTPLEMEWTTAVMMADDQSLRNLSKQKPPFYARADFLKT